MEIEKQNKGSIFQTISYMFMLIGIGIVIWSILNIPRELSYKKEEITSENITLIPKPQEQTKPKDIALYPKRPLKGDSIGTLTIPVLERKIPIFEGTEKNELKKGVGHFADSSLPGEKDNVVISGHSQTSFRKLDVLQIGDKIIVETSAGKFTYAVNNIKIVNEEDRTIIVPTDHGVLTLTTCYPFVLVGKQPYRYIVSANLIESQRNTI